VSCRPPPPPGVWFDERLVVGEPRIEGHGLFFAEDLLPDTVVIRLGGRLVSSSVLGSLIATTDADPDATYVDTITVYEDAHLVLPPDTLAHYANHSCDPTLWCAGLCELVTRRAVASGEEAIVDYGTLSGAPGFDMTCRCGAPSCRGRVTSDDW